MQKVWKFEVISNQPIVVPKGTKILIVREQNSTFGRGIMAWGLVPSDHGNGSEEVELIITGTGFEFELTDGFSYLNSFEYVGGMQYHVFIRYAV